MITKQIKPEAAPTDDVAFIANTDTFGPPQTKERINIFKVSTNRNGFNARFLNQPFDSPRQNVSKDYVTEKLQTLHKVFEECSKRNWDGYNAPPIRKKAYNEAKKIIKKLPSNIPMPDIVPEPDGDIGLDWYKEKHFGFIISVSGNSKINYAGVFGEGNTASGSMCFKESIPSVIIKHIEYLFSKEVV